MTGHLPPLRDELELLPGPPSAEGWPTWTLHDPMRNAFFRIGWPAFEILSRWRLGTPDAIADAIRSETTLDTTPDDVQEMVEFTIANQLVRPTTPDDSARLERRLKAEKHHWTTWLLHNYLFFRIPLVRPDAWLLRALPFVAWAFSRKAVAATAVAFTAGLVLASRQWETFWNSLVATTTLEGVAWYGVTLAAAKVVHELAHAFAARRYGCRVPTMGLAFLVMWPVLYTDVTDAWKLVDRRKRLLVGGAGILAELALGAWALLAWGLLPDGPARAAAFMLATTTTISTLVLNASPFMRFDGYFLAMDALDMPNLHGRSFAMARWWLREMLFDLGDPPPEAMPRRHRQLVIAFAVATWIYRLALFLGIAVLVYAFFIKVVGILLFAVEIGWFVIRPVASEVTEWWKLREAIRGRRRRVATTGGIALVLALSLLPLQSSIRAPGLLEAGEYVPLYAPVAGHLTALPVTEGEGVAAGDVVATLASPDLQARLNQARARADVLGWEASAVTFEPAFRERTQVIAGEWRGAQAEIAGLEMEIDRLEIRAPVTGTLIDRPPDLAVGQWISAVEPLGAVRGGRGGAVTAYVSETDLGRIHVGAEASFHPDASGQAIRNARVAAVEAVGTPTLPEPALASAYGGPIAVRATDQGLVPEQAVVRVRLHLDDPPPPRQLRGTIVIEGDRVSWAGRLWRSAAAVLMRELGF